MPISSELELPVKYLPITGPAVDALEARKENSSNPRIAASELRDSYDSVKDELFAGIGALARAVTPQRGGGTI